MILRKYSEGSAIFCSLTDVFLGGCEVGFWVQGLVDTSIRAGKDAEQDSFHLAIHLNQGNLEGCCHD